MSNRTFISHAHHYETNIRDASSARAIKARMDTIDGNQEPAIALMANGHPRLVLPTSIALQIANQIADIATQQQTSQEATK